MTAHTSYNSVVLPLKDDRGREIATIRIAVSPTAGAIPPPIVQISKEAADHWGEQPVQLLEGRIYDYEIIKEREARLRQGVFRAGSLSTTTVERGTVVPGGNTGILPIILEDRDGRVLAEAAVEVRSSKLQYREQYRQMLEYISEQSVGLVTDIRAAAYVRMAPRPGQTPATVAQQYAFLSGLLGGRAFKEALSWVLASPQRKTIVVDGKREVAKGLTPGARVGRELARRQPRSAVPAAHPLAQTMRTAPRYIEVSEPRDSYDTAENRFVKYVLTEFSHFLQGMEVALTPRRGGRQNDQLFSQVSHLRAELEKYLSHRIFSDVSTLKMLPLASTVLQGRVGYRELLRCWLTFSLAANLNWDGGDDVYASGKKNVALLYEYWLFFRLLDLFRKKFAFPPHSLSAIIEKTSDGLGLKLKSGQHHAIYGEIRHRSRLLRIRYSYNRTFRQVRPTNLGGAGSWTKTMRPDYTLSIWPASFSEKEAEEMELMVHLHFDAKYRIDEITDFMEPDDASNGGDVVDLVKSAKRDDLLKMHAYRDAIRRTSGAYVLYPGTETVQWRQYHEILPNLGAFAISPSAGSDGTAALSDFIDEVVEHLCDRASQRERISFHIHNVHAAPSFAPFHAEFPERARSGERAAPLSDQYVLLARSGTEKVFVFGDFAYVCVPLGTPLDPRLMLLSGILLGIAEEPAPNRFRVVSSVGALVTAQALPHELTSSSPGLRSLDGLYLTLALDAEITQIKPMNVPVGMAENDDSEIWNIVPLALLG